MSLYFCIRDIDKLAEKVEKEIGKVKFWAESGEFQIIVIIFGDDFEKPAASA